MASRRVLSLVVALLASLIGLPLLWHAGSRVLFAQTSGGSGGGDTPLFVALAVLGALLVALSGFAVRWSSLGPIVVGGLHLAISLLAVLVPYDPRVGLSPGTWLLVRLNDLDVLVSNGAAIFTFQGVGLLVGAALVSVGIAARLKRASPGGGWGILAAIAGVVALPAAFGAISVGRTLYVDSLVRFDPHPLLGLLLAVLAVLFGLLLLPAARSAVGLWIVGGGLTLAGAGLAVPATAPVLPVDWMQALSALGLSGFLLAFGFTVLGLALGVTLRPVAPLASASASGDVSQEPVEPSV